LGELSSVAQQAEVQGLDDLVFAAVGIQPKTIRPPYGNLPVGGIADAHQRPVVLWSVDSLDWKNRTPSKIVSVVLEQAGPGDIILMHETSRRSVEALPQILEGLRDKGLTVVSVAQLLGTGYRSPEKIERVPYTCPTPTSASVVNPWCVVFD
jgi:peptidoglycan/xylan/chitin deacetylase (PgdA/CDA1 family)